jgi:hypothetical protein
MVIFYSSLLFCHEVEERHLDDIVSGLRIDSIRIGIKIIFISSDETELVPSVSLFHNLNAHRKLNNHCMTICRACLLFQLQNAGMNSGLECYYL